LKWTELRRSILCQTDISQYFTAFSKKLFFPVSELATFRLINTRLQGHPTTHDNLPGVRIASGSLGQGLSVAIELHKKLNNH
jgi:transketolase